MEGDVKSDTLRDTSLRPLITLHVFSSYMEPEDVDFVDFGNSAVRNPQLRTAGKDSQNGSNRFNGYLTHLTDLCLRLSEIKDCRKGF